MSPLKVLLHQFAPIATRQPYELILEQLCQVIEQGILRPGQKLPPESALVERFATGRGPVREALRRMEVCGVVQFRPPNHFYFCRLQPQTAVALIQYSMRADLAEYPDLMRAREALEAMALQTIATAEEAPDLSRIAERMHAHAAAVGAGLSAEEEEALVHIEIAMTCGNSAIGQSVVALSPEIIKLSQEYNICRDDRPKEIAAEHEQMLHALRIRDGEQAVAAFRRYTANSIAVFHDTQRAPASTPPFA